MAFFGLTEMGYQDTIREKVVNPTFNPQYDPMDKLPPIVDREKLPRPSIIPINQVSAYGAGPQGSYVEYTRQRTKHIRNPKGPLAIYRDKTITSHDYGWWNKDAPLKQKEPWTHVKRHVFVNSEMTRFVNEMSLTNREFSLF
ncbi:testis-expressed protein 49 [Lingula anatina]|uniref:Testis-expressed protein 49 n=1 Tax=Lingula anatina TaxID=7574 RepID=A0A1S3GZY9_LINAN|nr:testis-expressed protein 49-like [Lingula anatina]XP_013419090.1 testis-expressed protein 49 [Lingula anatina]|eukprot:XP_013379242.1 testis-expressed protein 49-like [Lingula anatina]